MDINKNLMDKINEFPNEMREFAELLFKDIDLDKTKVKIMDHLKDEIRETVIAEDI